MNGYPIQAFWAGKLSDLEIACLKSWVGHGHPVILYSYQDLSGLPEGVTLADARDIIPEDEVELFHGDGPKSARDDAFSYLPFSDKFRYRLLRMNGGIWLDMDIVLISPIPTHLFDMEFFCSSERTMRIGAYKSKEPFKPTVSVIYCREPESDLMVELTNIHTKPKTAWDGQKDFGKWLTRLGLDKGVLQPSAFCDMNWWDIKNIFGTVSVTDTLPVKWGVPGTAVKWPEEALGIHCWRGLLRKEGLPYEKAADFSPLSYLGRLYHHAGLAYAARPSPL
jgi:hypothetical protein